MEIRYDAIIQVRLCLLYLAIRYRPTTSHFYAGDKRKLEDKVKHALLLQFPPEVALEMSNITHIVHETYDGF